MREEYHVTLYSQMGPREGRLDLQYEGSAVTGSLELMGRRNPVHGVRSEDGHLCLSHAIRTAVSTLFCETALELHGERLTGVTTADVCRMRWEGSRISPEPWWDRDCRKELKLCAKTLKNHPFLCGWPR